MNPPRGIASHSKPSFLVIFARSIPREKILEKAFFS